jgi:hypothetical protein
MSSKTRAGVVNIRKQFRKTKMCSYHLAGRCTFGAQCFYAHSAEELNDAPDLKKTKLCTAWQEGSCTKADCGFAHGAKELRSTSAVYKTVQCQWFATGHCSLGNACRYAHGTDEDRSTTVAPETTKKKKNKKGKGAKDKALVEPVEFPLAAAAALNAEFMRNLDGQQKDILTEIVKLCSQINSADGTVPRPPPGLEMPIAPSPLFMPTDADGKFRPGFATPSTIASTNVSPLFLPTADQYSAAFSPLFFPQGDHANMSPMRDMALPAAWLDPQAEA